MKFFLIQFFSITFSITEFALPELIWNDNWEFSKCSSHVFNIGMNTTNVSQ